MQKLTYRVLTSEKESQQMWNLFSPHKRIDDEWDFRYTFVKHLEFPFHFIVGYDGEKPVGLLPLQLNTGKGLGPKLLDVQTSYFEFFGGVDTDDNDVMLLPRYEHYATHFLEQVKELAIFTSLVRQYAVGTTESTHYLDRFELDLESNPTFEVYLQNCLDGKSRQRLINRINKLNKMHTIEIVKGSRDDLLLLFNLSITRFGEKSSFNMEYRQKIFYDLFDAFNVDLFVIKVDGVAKAVSFCIVFKKSYISINVGYDLGVRDLGKLVVVTQIKRALEHSCNRYDAGQGDNGWKERFNLTKIPQYKLIYNHTQSA